MIGHPQRVVLRNLVVTELHGGVVVSVVVVPVDPLELGGANGAVEQKRGDDGRHNAVTAAVGFQVAGAVVGITGGDEVGPDREKQSERECEIFVSDRCNNCRRSSSS